MQRQFLLFCRFLTIFRLYAHFLAYLVRRIDFLPQGLAKKIPWEYNEEDYGAAASEKRMREVNMKDHEREWDKLLQIATSGRDDSSADAYRYPYEPTPYCVLERLAKSGLVKKGDVLLDYGCGKGRADFFLAYQTGAHTVGVEYDGRIYKQAGDGKRKKRPLKGKSALRAYHGGELSALKGGQPLLFLQPLFGKDPAKGNGKNAGVLLRKPQRDPAFLLLSLRRVSCLPDDGQRA